jgi:N-dimethylarginine dimethylaminohydrolase
MQDRFPSDKALERSLNSFQLVLEEEGVCVLRPQNIHGVDQIFARDVGFVVDDRFVVSSMIEDRQREWEGVQPLLGSYEVLQPPGEVHVEGGDVLVLPHALIVGYSDEQEMQRFKTARTNRAALDWLSQQFPNRKVVGCQLIKSDHEVEQNVLHLDCGFMPLGLGHCLLFEEGFKDAEELQQLRDELGEVSYLFLDRKEMIELRSNLFSIRRDSVVSDLRFERVNEWLRSEGYRVHELDLSPVGALGGLFRCTTLPLYRKNGSNG